MRVVADTNTVVSGFLWKGAPAYLIDAAIDNRCRLLATDELIDELADVLSRPKFAKNFAATGLTAAIILVRYQLLVEMVQPAEISNSPLTDRDDDAILACAVGGKADFIISGDRHLLAIDSYESIPVITVNNFLAHLGK